MSNLYRQFKFQTWRNLVYFAYFDHNPQMSVKQVVSESDPFNCECRAYGRLKETNMEHIAIKCYGYVILSEEEEKDLMKQSGVHWTRPHGQSRLGIRGIVKEYMPEKEPFGREMIPTMRQDMLDLQKLGIAVWDLRTDNYMMGKIVDFSQAMVVPHRDLDLTIDPAAAKYNSHTDFLAFDGVVEDWNDGHPGQEYRHFFTPSTRNLRNMKTLKSRLYKPTERRYAIAAEYDWQKAAKARQQTKRSRDEDEQNQETDPVASDARPTKKTKKTKRRRR